MSSRLEKARQTVRMRLGGVGVSECIEALIDAKLAALVAPQVCCDGWDPATPSDASVAHVLEVSVDGYGFTPSRMFGELTPALVAIEKFEGGGISTARIRNWVPGQLIAELRQLLNDFVDQNPRYSATAELHERLKRFQISANAPMGECPKCEDSGRQKTGDYGWKCCDCGAGKVLSKAITGGATFVGPDGTPVVSEPATPEPDPADDAYALTQAIREGLKGGGTRVEFPFEAVHQNLAKLLRERAQQAEWLAKAEEVRESLLRDVVNTARRAETAETQLAEALKWDGDLALPEDEAIHAAHPTRSGSHETYAEAIRMVTAKRSKGALVDLVNWLLVRVQEQGALSARALEVERLEALVKGLETQVQARDASINRLLGQLGRGGP